MSWLYKGNEIEEIPLDAYGFVYKVTCRAEPYKDWIYIGAKKFYSITNKKLSKKRQTLLYKGKGRKPLKERVVVESNWKTYLTSSNFLQKAIEEVGRKYFRFEIIEIARNNTELLYLEANKQFFYKVFYVPSFNEWISLKINKNHMPK